METQPVLEMPELIRTQPFPFQVSGREEWMGNTLCWATIWCFVLQGGCCLKQSNFAAECGEVGTRQLCQGLGRMARGTWCVSSLGCPSLNAHFRPLVYYKKVAVPLLLPLLCLQTQWSLEPIWWLCKRGAAWSCTPLTDQRKLISQHQEMVLN